MVGLACDSPSFPTLDSNTHPLQEAHYSITAARRAWWMDSHFRACRIWVQMSTHGVSFPAVRPWGHTEHLWPRQLLFQQLLREGIFFLRVPPSPPKTFHLLSGSPNSQAKETETQWEGSGCGQSTGGSVPKLSLTQGRLLKV